MEEKTITTEKSGNIFTQALRVVKGENTQQLIESFTAEMTLVAEGLFEDQNKIRSDIEKNSRETDQRFQKINARLDELNRVIEEERKATDEGIRKLHLELQDLQKEIKEKEKRKKKDRSFISQLTTLSIIIAASAIIVTLLIKLL